MESFVTVLWWTAAVVFVPFAWDLLISLAGFLPLRRPPRAEEHARFAVLVCAHDEEAVIATTVENLLAQDYPRERFRLFLIADNCSDATAARARAAGAEVLERRDTERRGKGWALQWGIAQVRDLEAWDALVVFDADNHCAPDFLTVMNDHLQAGEVAVQGYLDTKNPTDSWVTRSIALAYFISNRFWFRARARLGLAATLGGTGYALRWDVVERYPWDPGCLTDDLELTQNLLLGGERVTFSYFARTYDEKPLALGPSIRQRSRWMQGHNDVASRFFLRLLWAAVRRPSLRCLDAALYLLQPLRILMAFLVLIAVGVAWIAVPADPHLHAAFVVTTIGGGGLVLVFVVYPIVIAATERVPLRVFLSLPELFVFGLSWLPAIVLGVARMRQRTWAHTTHAVTTTTRGR